MLAKKYYCRYRSCSGEVVVEQIPAASSQAAMRKVLLKHPLAEFLETPTEDAPDCSGNAVVYTSTLRRKLCIWFGVVLLAVIVSFAAYYLLKPDDDEFLLAEFDALTGESDYSQAGQHMVSVRTDTSIGSAFKVKIDDCVYLYTCFHCVVDLKPIVARAMDGRILNLGEFEICEGRDLVRFALPEENDGLLLAPSDMLRVGGCVIAYGDTHGGGVVTQNKGKILAVGIDKIEIDATILSGNSGGPVLNEKGLVVGVASLLTKREDIWSKGTRYADVRKFAERADGGVWQAFDYEEFRETYSFVYDTFVFLQEVRDFEAEMFRRELSSRMFRPPQRNSEYKGNFGYAGYAQQLYKNWNSIADADEYRKSLWAKLGGKVGTRAEENEYFQAVQLCDANIRYAIVTGPIQILQKVVYDLKSVQNELFISPREKILADIEGVLVPSFKANEDLVNRIERISRDNYVEDYKRAK